MYSLLRYPPDACVRQVDSVSFDFHPSPTEGPGRTFLAPRRACQPLQLSIPHRSLPFLAQIHLYFSLSGRETGPGSRPAASLRAATGTRQLSHMGVFLRVRFFLI